MRINRNIVECKYNPNLTDEECNARINRNIVECKFFNMNHVIYNFIELIETLWNVNERNTRKEKSLCGELIETLWNVNKSII